MGAKVICPAGKGPVPGGLALLVLAVALVLALSGPARATDYRQDMRDLVAGLAAAARAVRPSFAVVAQNGSPLLTADGTASGALQAVYAGTLSGQTQESLYYGYGGLNQATPAQATAGYQALLDLARTAGLTALGIDYCTTQAKVDDSCARSLAKGYLSFAAASTALNSIPAYPAAPCNAHAGHVDALSQARNFLYLVNPDNYATQDALSGAVAATNYDLVVLDAYLGQSPLSQATVTAMKTKANGGRRLVLAYLSVGEAEDYRPYWQPSWRVGSPSFIAAANPDWPGNYKVRYWDPDWKAVLYTGQNSSLSTILAAGFDGAVLDVIDAYEYFEQNPPGATVPALGPAGLAGLCALLAWAGLRKARGR